MGKRIKTGGRKAGTPNKATREIKEIAREYGAEAIEKLAHVMRTGEERAVVAAAKEILDRGFGKAVATVNADVQTNFVATLPEVCADMDEWQAKYGPGSPHEAMCQAHAQGRRLLNGDTH